MDYLPRLAVSLANWKVEGGKVSEALPRRVQRKNVSSECFMVVVAHPLTCPDHQLMHEVRSPRSYKTAIIVFEEAYIARDRRRT